MNDLRKAFAEKRVLVTGHTGFKGPWLLAMLESLSDVPKVVEDIWVAPASAIAPDTFPVVSP